jgi:hypothetical protein
MSIAAAPAGFPNAPARRYSANLDQGSKAVQVRKGRGLALRPDESSDLDTPAQHHYLIASLDFVRQAAQAFAQFSNADLMRTHGVPPCTFEVYAETNNSLKEGKDGNAPAPKIVALFTLVDAHRRSSRSLGGNDP